MNQRIKDIVNKHFSFDDEDNDILTKKRVSNEQIVKPFEDAMWINENFVDLNLPSGILWMKYNLGATCEDTPESWYGDYYGWGELETKESYSWTTYKHCTGLKHNITKYNDTDKIKYLQLCDDIANHTYGKIGNNIVMPDDTQFEELLENTIHKEVSSYNGIQGLNGMLLTSKTNKNSIFIPFAGEYQDNTKLFCTNSCGIWTSSVDYTHIQRAVCAKNTPKTSHTKTLIMQLYVNSRNIGMSIRPVLNKNN